MRTYLILERKARQFAEHREIQDLLAEIHGRERGSLGPGAPGVFSRAAAEQLKARTFDRQALASRRLAYERLDQLLVDLLLGA
jgi:xylose isomerase